MKSSGAEHPFNESGFIDSVSVVFIFPNRLKVNSHSHDAKFRLSEFSGGNISPETP